MPWFYAVSKMLTLLSLKDQGTTQFFTCPTCKIVHFLILLVYNIEENLLKYTCNFTGAGPSVNWISRALRTRGFINLLYWKYGNHITNSAVNWMTWSVTDPELSALTIRVSEWLNLTAFLGTADSEVHIVHISRVITHHTKVQNY